MAAQVRAGLDLNDTWERLRLAKVDSVVQTSPAPAVGLSTTLDAVRFAWSVDQFFRQIQARMSWNASTGPVHSSHNSDRVRTVMCHGKPSIQVAELTTRETDPWSVQANANNLTSSRFQGPKVAVRSLRQFAELAVGVAFLTHSDQSHICNFLPGCRPLTVRLPWRKPVRETLKPFDKPTQHSAGYVE